MKEIAAEDEVVRVLSADSAQHVDVCFSDGETIRLVVHSSRRELGINECGVTIEVGPDQRITATAINALDSSLISPILDGYAGDRVTPARPDVALPENRTAVTFLGSNERTHEPRARAVIIDSAHLQDVLAGPLDRERVLELPVFPSMNSVMFDRPRYFDRFNIQDMITIVGRSEDGRQIVGSSGGCYRGVPVAGFTDVPQVGDIVRVTVTNDAPRCEIVQWMNEQSAGIEL